MVKSKMYGGCMIGECPTTKGHITKFKFLGLDEAQSLIDKICVMYNWPVHKIKYVNRKTIHTFAVYNRARHEIRAYMPIGGHSVCTILHELAHYASHLHGKVFKSLHKKLLKEYLDNRYK
jgi:hypothetical protein